MNLSLSKLGQLKIRGIHEGLVYLTSKFSVWYILCWVREKKKKRAEIRAFVPYTLFQIKFQHLSRVLKSSLGQERS